MPIEGEIAVRLERAAGRITRVSIRSTRPLATARVVVGRRAGDAAALVPRLYSVCARAQGAASASALESAAGRPPSPVQIAARSFAVALENLQEDLRRLLIDVPKAIGLAAVVEPVAEVRRAFAPVLSAAAGHTGAGGASAPVALHAIDTAIDVVSRHVLGESLAAFAARTDAEGLEHWTRQATTAPARTLRAVLDRGGRLGESDVPTLPPMTREQVETMLAALAADAGFAAAPRLDGATRETGALARMATHLAVAGFVSRHGRGVAARLAARVADVARTAEALADGSTPARVDAWSTASGYRRGDRRDRTRVAAALRGESATSASRATPSSRRPSGTSSPAGRSSARSPCWMRAMRKHCNAMPGWSCSRSTRASPAASR